MVIATVVMLLEKLRIYLGYQKHLSHYLISESFLQENPIKQNSPELEWLRHPHALKKKKRKKHFSYRSCNLPLQPLSRKSF